MFDDLNTCIINESVTCCFEGCFSYMHESMIQIIKDEKLVIYLLDSPLKAIYFQNQAPDWFRTPVLGPAPGTQMRKPDCNGAVCYCNNEDYCNDARTNVVTIIGVISCFVVVFSV